MPCTTIPCTYFVANFCRNRVSLEKRSRAYIFGPLWLWQLGEIQEQGSAKESFTPTLNIITLSVLCAFHLQVITCFSRTRGCLYASSENLDFAFFLLKDKFSFCLLYSTK